VYRDDQGLRAVAVGAPGQSQTILEGGGTVLVRGPVVFVFEDLDWTNNEGDLSIWTAQHGTKKLGLTAYAEDHVSVNGEGTAIAYMMHKSDTTQDVMVQSTDGSAPVTLVHDVGRGSQETCRPNFKFVESDLFVAWCVPGSTEAKLSRFVNDGGQWAAAVIAEQMRPVWSASESGDRIVYLSSNAYAYAWEGGESMLIDKSVSWAMITPDGTRSLYTVSDQLRASPLPDIAPAPLVTNNFSVRVDWNADYSYAVFSREVNYDSGTKQDLLVASTGELNASPIVLEPNTEAMLTRSTFTSDGQHVMYVTPIDESSRTLHVRGVDGSEKFKIDGADTAVAAHSARIVYSVNRSDPNTWPITADIMVLDARGSETKLLREKTTDGRAFFVAQDGNFVTYVDAESRALMIQEIP
jgi:hypothetical protein